MFKCEKCGHTSYAHPEMARILGFSSGDKLVKAGKKVRFTVRPQLRFRGTRLFIPIDVGKNFEIVDILVGYNSHFIAPEPLPGPSFSQIAEDGIEGRLFDLEMAEISQDIIVEVRNIDVHEHHFAASLHGFDCE